MTKKLQTLLTLLLLFVGATSAWADDVTPTLDVCYRTNSTNNGWNEGYPKVANTTNAEFECNAQAGLFVLQKYTVADLDKVNKLVLRNVNSSNGGGDAIAIWVVAKNTTYGSTANFSTAWTSATVVADIVAAYTATTGIAPRATTGDVNTTYLVNGTNDKSDGNKFTISGDALTTLKNNAVDNTFTLLLTNKTADMKTNNSRKFCSSGSASNPLKLIASYNVQLESNSTTTYYETLNAAFDAIAASGTGAITLYGDATITSRCNVGAKTITVVPSKAGISITSSLTSSLWLLNNTAGGNLTIGSGTYQLTIGGSSVVTNSSNFLETSTKACTTLLNNVKFKNLTTTNNGGVVNQKSSSSAVLTLKNCAFENCTAPTGYGVVFTGSDEALILSGNNTFTNCSTYDIYLEKRFKVDETNGVTNTTPIKIFAQESNIKLAESGNSNIVAKNVRVSELPCFEIKNSGYGLYSAETGDSRGDMKVTEGYKLTVSAVGAATLVLPFDAKIPTGVTCYTLNYTSGNTGVKATEVEGTLAANKPVLVNAVQGTYTFANTALVSAATTLPTETQTYGALVGVYTDTYCPENDYLLGVKDNVVAFYHPAGENTNYIRAYRAYLHADGAGAREFIGINFGGETTGINALDNLTNTQFDNNAPMYNLAGQRVGASYKGVVIQNGKKYIKK